MCTCSTCILGTWHDVAEEQRKLGAVEAARWVAQSSFTWRSFTEVLEYIHAHAPPVMGTGPLTGLSLLCAVEPTLVVKQKLSSLVHATYTSNHHSVNNGDAIHMELISTHTNYSIHGQDGSNGFHISSQRTSIGEFQVLHVDFLGQRFLLVDMPAVGNSSEILPNYKGKPSPLFLQMRHSALPKSERALSALVKAATNSSHAVAAQLMVRLLRGACSSRKYNNKT